MGALVDVVFLLLIFFMLTGTLEPMQPLEVDPPISTTTAEPDDQALTILLSTDGRLALAGLLTERDVLLSQVRARFIGPGGHAVKLHVDGEVRSGEVLELIRKLRDAGADQVQILTRESAEL
jgi:biopolymer transport protein ExbD